MKKSPPPAVAASPTRFWRFLALLSLALNVALAAWAWRASPAREPVAPAAATPLVASGAHAALGSFMAENNRIPRLGWTESQFAEFIAGFRASYEGHPVSLDASARQLQERISQRVQSMLAAEQPDPIEDYFRSLREKEGVSRTASGLHYRITEPGAGPTPKPADTVEISFAARLPGGESVAPLSRVRVRMVVRDLLPGLAEGVGLLPVGGKALVYLPPALAFAEKDWPPQLPPHTPLVFFLELHDIDPRGTP